MAQISCLKKLYMSLLLLIFSHEGETNALIGTNNNAEICL